MYRYRCCTKNSGATQPRWHFALLVGHRYIKGANNGGHVANEPMAFYRNGLRIHRGPTHPVHANPSHPLVALVFRAEKTPFWVYAIRFSVSLVGLGC